MPWCRLESILLISYFHHLLQDGWKLSLKKLIMPGKLEILLSSGCYQIARLFIVLKGKAGEISFPAVCSPSVVHVLPFEVSWEGRKDRCQGQILILVQQDNSYWRIMEQEGCTQGPRDGLCLHWIQMLLPQMFLSLPMGTNPRRCSCCLFGKSQSLTALISNQG